MHDAPLSSFSAVDVALSWCVFIAHVPSLVPFLPVIPIPSLFHPPIFSPVALVSPVVISRRGVMS
jgi:hypothetical protein